VCHVSLPSSYRSRRGHIHLLRVLLVVGCRSKTPTHPSYVFLKWIGWKDYEVQKIAIWKAFLPKTKKISHPWLVYPPLVPTGPTVIALADRTKKYSRLRPPTPSLVAPPVIGVPLLPPCLCHRRAPPAFPPSPARPSSLPLSLEHERIGPCRQTTLSGRSTSAVACVAGARQRVDFVPVSVLDQQTYQGVPEVVDCAVRIVIGRPRTRRYAQGHGTQDLYRFRPPRWRTLHHVWGIKYGALRLVLVWFRCPARYPTLLYSPGGGFLVGYKAGFLVGLHGTSPSRIIGEF
jgi:hypothetical protein